MRPGTSLLAAPACALALALGVLVVGPASSHAQPAAPTTDPGRGRQWALDRIGADAAWAVATGAGATIAIVDSGVDAGHPDLADKVDATTDCVGHDDEPGGCLDGTGTDDVGHGTHVAGIAAASTDNGRGVAGVAPLARLLGVRVLANSCGPGAPDPGAPSCEAEGTESDVADGIRWAADRGADVINLSLGSVTQAVVGPGRAFSEALQYAWSKGAVPVLVAGNDLLLPGSLVDIPAIVVSATDGSDGRASYSNGVGNARWALAAPGGEADTAESCEAARPNGILSTFRRPEPGGGGTAGYACVAGTSMAAPHVAGALAVLRSAGFGPQEAVDRLLATATDLGAPGRDTTFGAGRVDLAAALAGVAPTGQPVQAAARGGPAATDLTAPPDTGVAGASDAEGEPVVGPGDGTDTEPAPANDATSTTGATTATSDAGERGGDETAGAASAPSSPGDDGDDVPPGLSAVAVLAVLAVGAGHAWRLRASKPIA